HLRRRLSASSRRVHHPTLRDLRPLRGLHHAGADAADPAVQRHAVLAVHGLRSRDGQHAHAAREPDAAVVPAVVEAGGRHGGVLAAGLYVPRHRLVLGDRGSAAWVYRGIAGPPPDRLKPGRPRHAHVVGKQPTRKFRRRNEFRDLPNFLASSALYPLWRVREGSPLLYYVCQLNPFTHAVELVRFALYCQINWISLAVVGGCTALFMVGAILAYDPARGFLARRGEPGGGT